MSQINRKRVRLADIAQASGVSLTAASLALGDKPGVSPATRARVLETARSMGYRLKQISVQPAGQLIKSIALLINAGLGEGQSSNLLYASVVSGIESTAQHLDIRTIQMTCLVDAENVACQLPSTLRKDAVDAVILIGVSIQEPVLSALEKINAPVVLVDAYAPDERFNSVLVENELGAYQAVDYLIRKGHHHIGFVGGHAHAFPSFRRRRQGYARALSENGIQSSYLADCSPSREQIASATLDLVHKHPQITALMGVNDGVAITVMQALNETGISIPEDISLIGFDDIYLAETVVPSLTTMRVSKSSAGRLAVQVLLNKVYQSKGCTVRALLTPVLVERNSVKDRKK